MYNRDYTLPQNINLNTIRQFLNFDPYVTHWPPNLWKHPYWVVVWCSGLSERFHRGVPGSIPPRAWSSKGCSVVVDGFAISGKS